MIKTAVVGLGKMGISHCSIVNAHPLTNLVAVCDTSTFILEAFKKYTNVSCYTDFNKMLANEKLDAVIIAVPTRYHYETVLKSLNKNLHVFCEKPFSLKSDEGRQLVDLAQDKKVVNQVGYHNRFLGTFNELKRIIDNDLIGEIYHFHGEAYGPVVTKDKSGTWRDKKEEGGGCLYDYASHVINLIQFIVGNIGNVNGTLLKNIFSKSVEDSVYSTLLTENKKSGQLSVNWSDETYRKMSTSITIWGKKGKVICDATELKIYLKEKNQKENLPSGWTVKYVTDFTDNVNFYLRGEEYSSQLDYFFQSIDTDNSHNVNSFESAYKTDLVIELLIEDSKKIQHG